MVRIVYPVMVGGGVHNVAHTTTLGCQERRRPLRNMPLLRAITVGLPCCYPIVH